MIRFFASLKGFATPPRHITRYDRVSPNLLPLMAARYV